MKKLIISRHEFLTHNLMLQDVRRFVLQSCIYRVFILGTNERREERREETRQEKRSVKKKSRITTKVRILKEHPLHPSFKSFSCVFLFSSQIKYLFIQSLSEMHVWTNERK